MSFTENYENLLFYESCFNIISGKGTMKNWRIRKVSIWIRGEELSWEVRQTIWLLFYREFEIEDADTTTYDMSHSLYTIEPNSKCFIRKEEIDLCSTSKKHKTQYSPKSNIFNPTSQLIAQKLFYKESYDHSKFPCVGLQNKKPTHLSL